MTREEKTTLIEELKKTFGDTQYFYVTDSSELNVEEVNNLRRVCFEKGVKMRVLKNKLILKALEELNKENNVYEDIYGALKGPTAIMFTETANLPAKIITDFRKKHEKPLLKAAFIDSGIYLGDDQLEILSKLKSKEELIGEIVGLLQSPVRNVLGALQSGGSTIAGIVKALSEREEN